MLSFKRCSRVSWSEFGEGEPERPQIQFPGYSQHKLAEKAASDLELRVGDHNLQDPAREYDQWDVNLLYKRAAEVSSWARKPAAQKAENSEGGLRPILSPAPCCSTLSSGSPASLIQAKPLSPPLDTPSAEQSHELQMESPGSW